MTNSLPSSSPAATTDAQPALTTENVGQAHPAAPAAQTELVDTTATFQAPAGQDDAQQGEHWTRKEVHNIPDK